MGWGWPILGLFPSPELAWLPAQSLQSWPSGPDPLEVVAGCCKLARIQAALQGAAAPLYQPHHGHWPLTPRSRQAPGAQRESLRPGLQGSPSAIPPSFLLKETVLPASLCRPFIAIHLLTRGLKLTTSGSFHIVKVLNAYSPVSFSQRLVG